MRAPYLLCYLAALATAGLLVRASCARPVAGPSRLGVAQPMKSGVPAPVMAPVLAPLERQTLAVGLPRHLGDASSLLEALGSRTSRGAALSGALVAEDLPEWLLERLRKRDFEPSIKLRLGYLLRGLLTVWDSLPYQPSDSREEYLAELLQVGTATDLPAGVLAFAWQKQRFLGPNGLDQIQGTRPRKLDGLQAGGEGEARANCFLALLEDALRGELDLGHEQTLLAYTGDPSSRVRALAYRILLEEGLAGGWSRLPEVFPRLSEAERSSLAQALGEKADPELAARLLLQLESRYGFETDLAGAWLALADREPARMGEIYLGLLQGGVRGPLPEGLDSLQDLAKEGSTRNHVLNCYAAAAGSSASGMDWSVLERAAAEDWNPLVRAGAWQALASSRDDAASGQALQQLLGNPTSAELRITGIHGDAHLVAGITALIQELGTDQQDDLRTAILGLEVDQSTRGRLLEELEGRPQDR